jgi:hypothetical protein
VKGEERKPKIFNHCLELILSFIIQPSSFGSLLSSILQPLIPAVVRHVLADTPKP